MGITSSQEISRRLPMSVPDSHFVKGTDMTEPFPDGHEVAILGMGCFWGAEKRFWQLEGVFVTAVGYAGGYLEHPTYQEVCNSNTGHAEVVLVVFDPSIISYEQLLKNFWEGHNPTQAHRQGVDVGSQYRSVIFTTSEAQEVIALSILERYQEQLDIIGNGRITTESTSAPVFYYAEEYHQQYMAKNSRGYC